MLRDPLLEEASEPPGDPQESPWPDPVPAPSEPAGDPRTSPWPEEPEEDR